MPEKAKKVLQKLKKIGFFEVRQTGSHIILENTKGQRTYISMHTKDLPKGTFHAILKQAGLSYEEYIKI